MYSLQLTCAPAEIDFVAADLWDAGTVGIREIETGSAVTLIAAFETNSARAELLTRFASFGPEWSALAATDWVAETERAWPGRAVGQKLFLAAPWREEPVPDGRIPILHNPGLACGTGEHPCTQLALEALEQLIRGGEHVADIGTGSGILAIAALRLGAQRAYALDIDESAFRAAEENAELNGVRIDLIAGSADCLRTGASDIVVANISASVLLAILSELERIARPGGALVLTGFPQAEASLLIDSYPTGQVLAREEWSCLVIRPF
jgi:ribosomal protein L11 methyltransferase